MLCPLTLTLASPKTGWSEDHSIWTGGRLLVACPVHSGAGGHADHPSVMALLCLLLTPSEYTGETEAQEFK